jgi:hypothetical protein
MVAAVFLSLVPEIAEKLSQELTGVIYGCVMLAAVFLLPLMGRWRRSLALGKARASDAGLAAARPGSDRIVVKGKM